MSRPTPDAVRLERIVVAIDGPSGSGKSSVSRAVATQLGLRYLDTGAMYRAITWWMVQHDVDIADPEEVASQADRPVLQVGLDPSGGSVVVNGTDVAEAIRSTEITAAVSAVSAVPAVRARLVEVQRSAVADGGIVMEGRDIGTVVLPDADVKVFLTASDAARAARRAAELPAHGDVAAVRAAVNDRDRLDSSRAISPLLKAEDAVEIDATHLTLDEVVAKVVDLVRTRAAESRRHDDDESRMVR